MPALRFISFILIFMLSACAKAESGIIISNAWARATAPGQQVAAAYMSLKSEQGATLIKAESDLAGTIELHSMTMENDVMKMRMLNELPLPAGKTVNLEPGGYHLMLFDLKQPLNAGQTAKFKLHLRTTAGNTQSMTLSLPIKTSPH